MELNVIYRKQSLFIFYVSLSRFFFLNSVTELCVLFHREEFTINHARLRSDMRRLLKFLPTHWLLQRHNVYIR